MDRQYYLDLAQGGLIMPVAADVIMHQHEDAAGILVDGVRLGQVIIETAEYFKTPLAIPHMDLELEKMALLTLLGIPDDELQKYHFTVPPTPEQFALLEEKLQLGELLPRMQAHIDSVGYVAAHAPDLLPIGMSIGPFSLMSKMVADPITPIALAGSGLTAEDEEDIAVLEGVLELGTQFILHSIRRQIALGVKAVFIAEPAANRVYLSPNQIDAGSDIFERFVMQYMLRVKKLLDENDVDLIFHCCGELENSMLKYFSQLDPAVMSLGSSRKLWEDAAIVPKTTVLYGNLPSKRFYSDALITRLNIIQQGRELIAKMKEVGHPFILGTECDVLSVPGCEAAIMSKLDALMTV